MTTITSGYAPIKDGQLYYEMAGEGPAVILIHAGIADRRMWDAQMEPFAARYRVVRYDTRGFGKTTSAQAAEFSNRQDLADLMKHLGIGKAALIGVSRGGQIAIDFTLEFTHLVSALIPVGAGLGGFDYASVNAPDEMAMYEKSDALYQQGQIDEAIELDLAIWVDGFRRTPEQVDAQVRAQVRQMLVDMASHREDQLKPIVLTPPAAGRLSEIPVPTLVIVGALDTTETHVVADVLASGIQSDVRKAIIPDTAHVPNLERPDDFNRIVFEFLDEVLG